MIKWLRRIGLVIAAAIAVVVVLRVGFGLHVYMDGDFGLHLAFGKPSAHYDALEAQRAAQRATPARGGSCCRRGGASGCRRGPGDGGAAAPTSAGPTFTGGHRSRRHRPPPSQDRGRTFAARPATASTASARSPRPGRPAGRACSGSSRSASATRRS